MIAPRSIQRVLLIVTPTVAMLAATPLLQAQSFSAPGAAPNQQTNADGTEIRPPDPGKPEAPGRVAIYVVAVLLSAAAIGVAVMPSKRTHQD